jgi:hypothetical protein
MSDANTPSMRRIAIALVFFAIVGCSSFERQPNVFTVVTSSGEPRTFSIADEWLARLRNQWTPTSATISRTTKLVDTDRQWVLDFIALNVEREKCKLSDLERVTLRPLDETITAAGQRVRPSRYNEAWSVNSCGKSAKWLIYDSGGNLIASPDNP